MNIEKVGSQIAMLRRQKGLTQQELADRLGITFQAVSKWERCETLPDTVNLVDLADILETSVDFILKGGDKVMEYKGKITVSDMIEGLRSLENMGKLLGRGNLIYRHAVRGINEGMNVDFEEAFANDFIFEAFVAEAIIQNLQAGAYIDPTDVRIGFKHEHFRNIVLDYCKKCGIK